MKQVEQVKQVKQVEHVVTSHEVSSEVEAKSLRDVTVPQLQLRHRVGMSVCLSVYHKKL